MLTPQETAAVAALLKDIDRERFTHYVSADAHSAIAKLLERELRLQSPEFEERLYGVVQLATVDTGLAVRSVLHVFDLVSRAPEGPPPTQMRVAIVRGGHDGHEGRTTKYYEKLLGFCVCAHCSKLPDWPVEVAP